MHRGIFTPCSPSLSAALPVPVVLVLFLVAFGFLSSGCATTPVAPKPHFEFFAHATPADDPWFAKVSEWQSRAQLDQPSVTESRLPSDLQAPTHAAQSEILSVKMAGFALAEKRQLARRINIWSQVQSHDFYKVEDDADPSGDHWPTFGQLLGNNGDDCDGLDLMAYHLLLEFGYPRDQIYRAIVRRNSTQANHMVTLWFEDPKDPWVIDATGAMVFEMTRFSSVDGWTPTKIFNETEQYKVVQSGASKSFALVRD